MDPNIHRLLLVVHHLQCKLFSQRTSIPFLNGVSSISKEGVELNIMRATGDVSACKEICPNHLFLSLYFKVYNW